MSATGRSGVRHPDDFYRTPDWATLAICSDLGTPRTIVDPGCGTGAIGTVARRVWPDATIVGYEIDEGRAEIARATGAYDEVNVISFLRLPPRLLAFDLALGNPPYNLAAEFVTVARSVAETVSYLLRVNYLGSQDRAPFHRAHPSDLAILPRRPSFAKSVKCKPKEKGAKGCGWEELMAIDDDHPKRCPVCGGPVVTCTSDATEYAWFTWGPGRTGKWKIVDLDAPSLRVAGVAG